MTVRRPPRTGCLAACKARALPLCSLSGPAAPIFNSRVGGSFGVGEGKVSSSVGFETSVHARGPAPVSAALAGSPAARSLEGRLGSPESRRGFCRSPASFEASRRPDWRTSAGTGGGWLRAPRGTSDCSLPPGGAPGAAPASAPAGSTSRRGPPQPAGRPEPPQPGWDPAGLRGDSPRPNGGLARKPSPRRRVRTGRGCEGGGMRGWAGEAATAFRVGGIRVPRRRAGGRGEGRAGRTPGRRPRGHITRRRTSPGRPRMRGAAGCQRPRRRGAAREQDRAAGRGRGRLLVGT